MGVDVGLVQAMIAIAAGVFVGSVGARWLLLAEMLLHRRWHRWQNREAIREQAVLDGRQRITQERILTASARATAASITRLDEDDDTRIAFGEIIEALAKEDEAAARDIASEAIRSSPSEIHAVDPTGQPLSGVPEAVTTEIAIEGMISAARYVASERQRER